MMYSCSPPTWRQRFRPTETDQGKERRVLAGQLSDSGPIKVIQTFSFRSAQ